MNQLPFDNHNTKNIGSNVCSQPKSTKTVKPNINCLCIISSKQF